MNTHIHPDHIGGNAALAGPDTRVIPGHGLNAVGRGALVEFRDMIVTVRDRVAGRIEQGASLPDVMRSAPTADFDAKWGQEESWSALEFVPIVYNELGGGARFAAQPD